MTTEVKSWDNHHYSPPHIWVLWSGSFWDWWGMREGHILLRVLQDGHESSPSNHTMTQTSWECLRDNFVNVIEGPMQHPDLNKSNILSFQQLSSSTRQYLRGSAKRTGNISSNQRWQEAVVTAKGTKCQLKGQQACCYTICQLFLVDF